MFVSQLSALFMSRIIVRLGAKALKSPRTKRAFSRNRTPVWSGTKGPLERLRFRADIKNMLVATIATIILIRRYARIFIHRPLALCAPKRSHCPLVIVASVSILAWIRLSRTPTHCSPTIVVDCLNGPFWAHDSMIIMSPKITEHAPLINGMAFFFYSR